MSYRAEALAKLRPNAKWTMRGDDITWEDENQTQPTEQELVAKTEARAQGIESLDIIEIPANAGEEGKLFGSIGTRDIAEAVSSAGCEVDKSEIRLPDGALRQLGEYQISIQLHGNVSATVNVSIVQE